MYSCVICNNSSDKNIAFHPFPKDMAQRMRWLKSLRLLSCTDTHLVCSNHFLPADFRPGEKRVLRQYVVPKLCPVVTINKTSDDSTTQAATMNTQHNSKEQVNDVSNNMTISPSQSSSAINFTPRHSSRKRRKPKRFSSSDEVEVNKNKICKKKKYTKKINSSGMLRCSVKNCRSKYPTRNLSFFRYPEDEVVRRIWIKNCDVESIVGRNYLVKSHLKVCGRHFEDDMFHDSLKRNRLLVNAVPTVFDNRIISDSSESIENVEDSEDLSTNNDKRIVGSSKLLNTEDEQELENEEYNMADYECCVPGCVFGADYSNENDVNANLQIITLFSPSSIESMNKWSSALGISLTMNSNVCERHFKPEDLQTHDIFISFMGLSKLKELCYDAMPIKI